LPNQVTFIGFLHEIAPKDIAKEGIQLITCVSQIQTLNDACGEAITGLGRPGEAAEDGIATTSELAANTLHACVHAAAGAVAS
jgi:hypothetical protein